MVSDLALVVPIDNLANPWTIEHKTEKIAGVVTRNREGVRRKDVVDESQGAVELLISRAFTKLEETCDRPKPAPEWRGHFLCEAGLFKKGNVVFRQVVAEKILHATNTFKE